MPIRGEVRGTPLFPLEKITGEGGRGWTEWKREIIMGVMKSAGVNLVEYL